MEINLGRSGRQNNNKSPQLKGQYSRKHIHHRGKETCALKATTPFYSVIQRCQVH